MNGEALIRFLGSLGAAGVAAAVVWLAAVGVAFGYARSGRLGRGLRLGLELGLLGVVLLGARDLAWMVLAIRAAGKLWWYFGVTGIASALAWMAALYLFARHGRGARRTRYYWIALALAIAGLALAKANSVSVSSIVRDDTADLLAARARLEKWEGRKREKLVEVKKETDEEEEEEPPEEAAPPPASTNAPAASTNAPPALAEPVAADPSYAYKEGGVKRRTEGKKVQDSTLAGGTTVEASRDTARERKMPDADVRRANDLDRFNLLFARTTFWLALLLALADYLGCFNRTFGAYLPLPIASRATDSICTNKKYSAWVRCANPGAMRDFLEHLVHKGETFVYFGRTSPWVQQATPSRLPRIYRMMLFGRRLLPLPRVRCVSGRFRFGNTFVAESAWFARYCFEVDPVLAARWVDAWVAFLEGRRKVLASARRTVNLVWDMDPPFGPDVLERLLILCRETNHRLVLVGESPWYASMEFEETVGVLERRKTSPVGRVWQWIEDVVRGERDLKTDLAAAGALGASALRTIRSLGLAAVRHVGAEYVTALRQVREWRLRRASARVAARERAERERVRRRTEAEARRETRDRETHASVQAAEREAAQRSARDEEKRRLKAEAEARAAAEAERRRREAEAVESERAREAAAREEARRRAREEETRRRAAEKVRRDAERAARDELRTRQKSDRASRPPADGETAVAVSRPPSPARDAMPVGDSGGAGFHFRCPACRQKLAAEPGWVGSEIRCPACDARIAVPSPDRATEPESPGDAPGAGATFQFQCPRCGKKLLAEREWIGMDVQCPSCDRTVRVESPPVAR